MQHVSQDGGGPGTGTRALFLAACFVVIVAGLREAQSILPVLLLSMFLAMLAVTPMRLMQERGVPSGLAVLIVFLGLISLFALLGLLVADSGRDFMAAWPIYQEILEQRLLSLSEPLREMLVTQGLVQDDFSFMALFDPASVMGSAVGLVGRLVSSLLLLFSNTFMALLTTIFILLEAAGFPKKAQVAMRQMGMRPESMDRFSNISRQVRDYLAIKTVISLVTGLLLGFWCWAWGVSFPVLWGVLGFLLNYIPTIGSIVAALPPLGLALINGSVGTAFGVITGYVAVNMLLGNVLEPRVLGHRLGLSSLVVLLSLVFWGWVWGPLGMLLSVPLTMIVKILLENSGDLRWLGTLLSSAEALPERET
ncbi:MAG TPA: AI-2E family transporter [Acidobacteriota bacterium]|nr:AI-2E family transporter [Acidobacteriota bacterium]